MNSQPPDLNDDQLLRELGYKPELARRMSGFSNFAISLSIICILAGGITSFHVGLCSAGGGAIGVGWPLACLFSLTVALTMAQVASAFPTAGGLYHWGSLLGGRACGWITAWFNLAGLITVVAAVNAGAYDFAAAAFQFNPNPAFAPALKTMVVAGMTLTHALLNHYGMRLTTRLTDFSGYLILAVTAVLVACLAALLKAPPDWSRLWTFVNYSGLPESGAVFPKQDNLPWLFALGLMLPAYTITGFDASAHTSEETLDAAKSVPKGIVRSVWVSGLMGWILVATLLLALPNVREGAERGGEVVPWILRSNLPSPLAHALLAAIVLAQFLCGLAALTSASRMTFAFARDNGLPGSQWLKRVDPASGSPSTAVWCTGILGALFTVLVPYTTIAAVCVIFLYISYVLPVAAGLFSYGRTWTRFGPFQLGALYRPLALIACLGCLFLIVVGMQPPNQQAVGIVGGAVALLIVVWFAFERKRFPGPPPPSPALAPRLNKND